MESISRLSSFMEQARDLTLEAARDVGPRKTGRPLPAQQIKKLLDSRHEREVLDGLRRIVAMQYANPPQPTLPYFAAVLKTLSNPYPSTRPLVYNYLVHHAAADPDTALLSINTIQKSLSDSNPRVRAMALKTMAGVRVPVISQIVSLAIKKGVSDLSPIVRKAAALACVKCVRLDESTRPQVEDYVAALLNDKQYYVAGVAVQAFMEVCPTRIELIHPVYRKLCRMVVDMDEWGQLATIRLMLAYARRCFPLRKRKAEKNGRRQDEANDRYEDLEPAGPGEDQSTEGIEQLDPDLELFLRSVQPLLHSRNSAVILAVCRAYLLLAPSIYLPQAIGPLVALLRSPVDIKEVALHNVVQVCLAYPKLFVPYTRQFLIRASDPLEISRLKLELLTLTFPHATAEWQDLVLVELEHFSHGVQSPELVRESVRAIGRCAQTTDAQTSRRCLTLLLKQIHSPDSNLVGEAIEVVRHLIQRDPDGHRMTVIRLAKNLDNLRSPAARASVIWLVGEYSTGYDEQGEETGIAADVLRILLRSYADEDDSVRAQILLLAAKCYLHHLNHINARIAAEEEAHSIATDDAQGPTTGTPTSTPTTIQISNHNSTIPQLYSYALLLAHYTPSYPSATARLYRAVLPTPSTTSDSTTSQKQNTDLATLLLFAPKPVPSAPSPAVARRGFKLGSASLVVGGLGQMGRQRAEEVETEWVVEGQEPEQSLRDEREREGGEEGETGRRLGASAGVGVGAGGEESAIGVRSGGGGTGAVGGVGKKGVVGGAKAKTLDDWLDETDGGSEEVTETESETEDEDEDEDEESDDDDDDEDEEDTDGENEEEDETESDSEEEDVRTAERKGLVR